MAQYFYRDATGRLAEVIICEDGFSHRRAASFRCQRNEAWPGKPGQKPAPAKYVEIPGAELAVPAGALPCPAAEYEAALHRVLDNEKQQQQERGKEIAFLKSLRNGLSRQAHAAEQAGAAEALVVEPPLPAAVPFLDDFTILDFETSDSYAIELAAVRVRQWQIVDQLQSLIQFRGPLNRFTRTLTGITPQQLWHAPPEKTVLQQFRKLAGDSLLVAHHAAFDLRHLEAARTRQGARTPLPNPSLCTLVVAKSRYPPPHKLGALCQRFGLAVVGAHRAMADVRMTYALLRYLHQQQPIEPALVGANSAAQAQKKAVQPSLFAA
jgi:DNA polymerase-3 subunit epsilon/DNA polymerase-3 subunit alpha (Gram-positive type)